MENNSLEAKWLTYLDDGIIASDYVRDLKFLDLIRAFHYNGLAVNAAKSKFVKFDGEWICNLKFLGALFTTKGEFFAATRKGSSQQLKVPPIGNISTMSVETEWQSDVTEFVGKFGLQDAQIAWIYNKGGFYDGKRFIPVDLGTMTEKML